MSVRGVTKLVGELVSRMTLMARSAEHRQHLCAAEILVLGRTFASLSSQQISGFKVGLDELHGPSRH